MSVYVETVIKDKFSIRLDYDILTDAKHSMKGSWLSQRTPLIYSIRQEHYIEMQTMLGVKLTVQIDLLLLRTLKIRLFILFSKLCY